MPTQVRIIRATEFLIVTATGSIDFERTQRLLAKVASASTPGPHKTLLDMREAHSALSATGLWNLALEVSRNHTPFHGKIAVLCRASGGGQADFFALCAQNRGFPVRAFTSFEEAINWLVEGGPVLEETV
jgi:hypothetical protein